MPPIPPPIPPPAPAYDAAAYDAAAYDASAVGAIVFDLGNVIIELDNARYGAGWPTDIGAEHEGFEAWVAGERLWYAFETGAVSTADFLARLSAKLGRSPAYVTDYWNALLVGMLPGVVEVLDVLRERYPLYVLSNTNALHIAWVRRHLAALGYADYETRWFERVFYSYELGAVKPEPAIYRRARAAIGLPPERLLFVDDRPENVAAARAQGWQAVDMPVGAPLAGVLSGLLGD